MKRRITVLVTVLLMVVSLCSCGAKNAGYTYETSAAAISGGAYYANADYAAARETGYVKEAAYEEAPMAAPASGVGYNRESAEQNATTKTDDTSEADHGRKLIRNVNVDMQTLEFDALYEGIKAKVSAIGGYVENSSVYNGGYNSYSLRNANITARVPQTKLDEFLNTAFANAAITNMSESTEDITLRYSDIESKVLSLRTEQERLTELLTKAETVEDLITIEERLSEVRYEIESYQSSLKHYDNQVTYSTVWIFIEEVKNITPPVKAGFGERIRTGWQKNTAELGEDIEDFLVWFITNLLSIVLTIAVIAAGIFILKKVFGLLFGKKEGKQQKEKKKLFKNKKAAASGTVAAEESLPSADSAKEK